jgi:hypothetical protein
MFRELTNRAQAFSVFELMIAAIVAVAILFVLLPILSGINPNATGGPKDAISNALSTVGNSGSVISQEFNLTNGAIITSKDFAEDGLDQQSVFLAIDEQVANSGIGDNFEIVTDNDAFGEFSVLEYSGATDFRASARVTCAATGTSLDSTLQAIDADNYEADGADGDGYCQDMQPCCIVIIQRS